MSARVTYRSASVAELVAAGETVSMACDELTAAIQWGHDDAAVDAASRAVRVARAARDALLYVGVLVS